MEVLEHIVKKLNKIEQAQQEMDKKLNKIVQEQKKINQIDSRLEEIHFRPLKSQQQKDTPSVEENDSYEEVDPSLRNIWSKITESIKKELTEVSYKTWIKPIEPLKIENKKIYLAVANDFTAEIIKSRYIPLFETVIKSEIGQDYRIEVIVSRTCH